MRLKNIDADMMATALEPLLDQRNMVGYAAARNARALTAACADFIKIRDDLIRDLGEKPVDENGNQTGPERIGPDSPNFAEFMERITPIAEVEVDVDIFTLPENDVIGLMSGREILELDWMLTREDED